MPSAASSHVAHRQTSSSAWMYDPLVVWGTVTTSIADWVKRIYRRVSAIFGEITTYVVMIASIPLSLVLYAFLLFVNWRLRNFSNTNISLNNQNYDRMYLRHVRLAEITKNMKVAPDVPLKKLPLLVRPFVSQLIIALKSITNYQAALAQKFEYLDTPYAPLPKGMQMMKAKDFADHRVKGYEYLA